ncbi:hypothetical protein F4861DRAFT_536092 [Xylaria intraflava]|nr:hypothetical protein F4861DRAFT_536092 [Xylaria intraflava]
MKTAFYLFSLLSLSPRVSGLQGWPGGTIVAGNAAQFDRDAWEASLAHPNATESNPIAGFDLSKQWPSAQVDGWRLSINVTSDIPGSQTMDPSKTAGKTFTGTSIFLQAPENQRTIFSNESALDETTWEICVVVIPNASQANLTAAQNGSCSVTSPQCATDLQQAYADKFARDQNCYGTPPSTPASCGDAINTGNFSVQQLPLASIGGREVFVTASEPHDPADETVWSEAQLATWPVLTIWGWNTRAKVAPGSVPTAQLSCISARNVNQGSQAPPSAGSRHGSSAFAALLVGSVVMYTLL